MQNPEQSQRLIEAGLALGEIAGLLDNSYLRDAFTRRQRIIEAAHSASLDGRPTDPGRLYAFLGRAPLPASRHLFGDEAAAKLFQALNAPGRTALGVEAKTLLTRAEAEANGFLPVAAAILRAKDSNTAAARLALAFALRKLAGPAEPALSEVWHGLEAARGRSFAALDGFISTAFHKASLRARDRARNLRAAVGASLAALKEDRADSRIHQIAALLFAGHPLSYARVVAKFGIARTAAVEHMARLVELGLVEPAVRRKTGQLFVARDGVLTFSAPSPVVPKRQERRLKVGLPVALTAEDRARLDAASEQVLADIAELDRVLGELNVFEE